MKLKFIFFIFLMTVGIQNSSSQSYKFLTTGYSVMEKEANGNWGKWSVLQNTSLVISLDTNKNRIIVYSQEVQVYDILNYEDTEENDKTIIHPFTCKDSDGFPFTISIITRKNQGNRKQLYINQKDVIIMYNMVNFIEKDKK